MDGRWKRKDNGEKMILRESAGVPMLCFPALEESGMVKHCFSTRLGGVSRGCFSTMNLSFTRGDALEDVKENYRRMARALDVDMEKMVLSSQTHTTNIRVVTEADAGKGVARERDYQDVDGLITNVPGLTLVTFFADCVPLYLVDPVHRAVGLGHSGWRGTVNRMGRRTAEAMAEAYGTRADELIVCIGPSICRDCYEVGEDVAQEFQENFPGKFHDSILKNKGGGKYLLDLWRANELVLLEAGVSAERIHVTDICTHCNPEQLFSHRTMGNNRGNLGAFLSLNP